jgi:hypothetical protein
MILEISEREYHLLRRALESHYYIVQDEDGSFWELKAIDEFEHKLISLLHL